MTNLSVLNLSMELQRDHRIKDAYYDVPYGSKHSETSDRELQHRQYTHNHHVINLMD